MASQKKAQINRQSSESLHRWKLARIITVISIAGIGIIAALVIVFADDKGQATQMVLTAVLPVMAAWISTVLAYYYSSESMEAATRNVKELMSLEQKLEAVKVSEAMISIDDLVYFIYSNNLKTHEVLNKLKEAGKGERIPFLDQNKYPVYMLHKSAVDDAIVQLALEGDKIDDLSFKELFEKIPGLEKTGKESFGTVDKDATLADVRDEMRRIPGCQDVFITGNGRKNSPVTGMITNVIIEDYSKL